MFSHRPTRGRTSFFAELRYLLWTPLHAFCGPKKLVSTCERLFRALTVMLISLAIPAYLVKLAYPKLTDDIDIYAYALVLIMITLAILVKLLERLHLISKCSDEKERESHSPFMPPLPKQIPIVEQLTPTCVTAESISSISSGVPPNSKSPLEPPPFNFALKGGVIRSKGNGNPLVGMWEIVQKPTE